MMNMRIINDIVRGVQKVLLQRRGWVLSNNVMISIHGVKKVGGGKRSIVLIMCVLMLNLACSFC